MIDRTAELVNALYPLCKDIPWMEDLIRSSVRNLIIPNDIELTGLIRCISYEVIKANPDLVNSNDMDRLLNLGKKTYPHVSVLEQAPANTPSSVRKDR